MAFLTIHTEAEDAMGRKQARHYGPRMVNAHGGYVQMLLNAGFRDVRVTDVTREYLRISLAWRRARDRHVEGLRAALGEARVKEMDSDSRLNIAGIERGLLHRSLFVATR
jgi:hypothetical protein